MYIGQFENEHYLLAAFLQGYEKESVLKNCIAYGLEDEHFTNETNKKIFKIIKSNYKRGIEINTCTVFDVADQSVKMKLAEFGLEGGGTLNYKFFLDNLMEDYFSKNATNDMNHLLKSYQNATDHDEKAEYWKKIQELSKENPYQQLSAHESTTFKESSVKFIDKLELELKESMNRSIPGIPTGIKFLDDVICGWRKGKLYVIGARAGIGKTTLACNFAYMAAMSGSKVCFFTVEMFSDEIAEKIVSRDSEIAINKIRLGVHSKQESDDLETSVAKLANIPFLINDKTRGSFETFERELRRICETGDVELVVFDYIQLFKSSKKTQSRNAEVSEITMSLKQLALELNVAIIALSQLNRQSDNEKRDPRPSDLRDSGSIEQDADVILFITSDANGARSLSIAKNRGGKQNISVDLKTNLSVNYLGE